MLVRPFSPRADSRRPLSMMRYPPLASRRPLAITFDFWDTLYDSSNLPERLAHRRRAITTLLAQYGIRLPDEEIALLYTQSALAADRWWREQHRGYTTTDRLHWMIERAGGKPRPDCAYVAAACDAVDEALLRYPPPVLAGAADAVRTLAERFPLAIVSDTGFASGRAQDALLAQDGLLECFRATVYSMDIGHAKPHPEPFRAAVKALGLAKPSDVIHIGDNERTDVGGALASGLRAVRVDVIRSADWARADDPRVDTDSAAEFVATTYDELMDYLSA